MTRTVALSGATVLLVTVAGCGDNAGPKKAERDQKAKEGLSAAADQSTCRAEAKPASKPYGKGFPTDWPFPSQTVVFNAQDRGQGGTVVTAVSSSPFKKILSFMNKDVVAQGFRIEKGETEVRDAEAEWKSNGFRGRWAIRESATCTGETVIQVLSTNR